MSPSIRASEVTSLINNEPAIAGRAGFAQRLRCRLFGPGVDESELALLLGRCRRLMDRGDCDAHLFERTAHLLGRAGRTSTELELCRYVRGWVEARRADYLFGDPMWLNRRYKRVIRRLPLLEGRQLSKHSVE